MALQPVRFEYLTGIMRPIFRSARLTGGWGADGRRSEVWTTVPMEPFVAEDGCPAFRATVLIDDSQRGTLPWGVSADGPAGPNVWAIPTEVSDHASQTRQLFFEPSRGEAVQRYHLTYCRRLGANKVMAADGSRALRFSVWAPNAQAVEVVFGDLESGYIADDGAGVLAAHPMRRDAAGVWHSEPLPGFAERTHTPYMYRVTDDAGSVRYRTDLYSRSQLGSGNDDPARDPPGGGRPPDPPLAWSGSRDDLDGAVSCSLVIDPDRVAAEFEPAVWPPTRWLDDADFWRDELDPLFPLPTRVEDLVIYELHVAGLGAGRPGPGRLGDALAFLDHLSALGVNAVELLPLAEFEGWAAWGYGSSHHFAIEFSGGGRDQFKHFIRAAHQRGIAVILDVVYNHYIADAERSEWAYDSQAPERNIYYWYEGSPGDYADPTGGYVDNQSTGWAPRLWDDMVRKLFISSAAALVAEFHVDGFRVDQTTSLHSYAVLHADGRRAEHANIFGAKFLREWTRTLNLIKPGVILIAEDHSGWAAVTQPTEAGGLGFDAAWYAGFYHHLIGDAADRGPSDARLLHAAGFGDDRPLALSRFADALQATGAKTVVYHESHDEAGNSGGSHRTLVVAANGAALVGETRRYAEARARVVTALSVLSAGTPMFFMGEEVGAVEDYRYDDFLDHREDFAALREGTGARLFRYYQDLLYLHRSRSAMRSRRLEVVGVHDANRVLAFRRDDGEEATLVIASLANHAYPSGYVIAHDTLGTAWWQEVFNSDSALYGGDDVGNGGATLPSVAGAFNAVLPANGVLVFRRSA